MLEEDFHLLQLVLTMVKVPVVPVVAAKGNFAATAKSSICSCNIGERNNYFHVLFNATVVGVAIAVLHPVELSKPLK
jgi:hypothetical protein